MSYILDALRKADAQRVRDPARGIHAQAVAAMPGASASRQSREQWVWGGVAALIVTAAVALWFAGGRGAQPTAALAPLAAPLAPAPAVAVVVMPPAPSAPPATVLLPAPARSPAAPPPPIPAPVMVVPPPAPGAPTDRTYSVAELPGELRQALPKFSVSGGVYSGNVAQRMLIVDGQVFNEGSEIAPGVVLEQIRAKTAVLKFRGMRISQPY